MNNFVGHGINNMLHGWAMSPQHWDNLLWFYGIIILWIGYKLLKSISEGIEDCAKSEEARDELLNDLGEWIVAFLPLGIVFFLYWCFHS